MGVQPPWWNGCIVCWEATDEVGSGSWYQNEGDIEQTFVDAFCWNYIFISYLYFYNRWLNGILTYAFFKPQTSSELIQKMKINSNLYEQKKYMATFLLYIRKTRRSARTSLWRSFECWNRQSPGQLSSGRVKMKTFFLNRTLT